MNRVPVQSSNVVSIGYQDGVLEVEFKSGVYRYVGVPAALHQALMASNSKGRFVNDRIKNAFPVSKLVSA